MAPLRHWLNRCRWSSLLVVALLPTNRGGAASSCSDGGTCQAHVNSLIDKLDGSLHDMLGKQVAIDAIEGFREGITGGSRVELPASKRQHLEKGSPLVSEVALDAKHRPVSADASHNLRYVKTIAQEVKARLHAIMPLKRPSNQKVGPSALLLTIDERSRLWIHTLEGEVKIKDFDLGHGAGRTVTHLILSPSQENHFFMTADDRGTVRVYGLKVLAKKVEVTEEEEEEEEAKSDDDEDEDDEEEEQYRPTYTFGEGAMKKQLIVSTNFSCAFSLPPNSDGEERQLTSMLPVERGTQILFVTGDSLGGVAVFHRNGTLKGRVKVTEDPGGIRGMIRGQGQALLFFSSHTFGFLSTSQVDVQYPPCTGWNSPLVDVAPDPSLVFARVVLALADGDVLIFSTTKGKSKACDLTHKFPRVSPLPFKVHMHRGHVLALPTPLEGTARKAEYMRELFFFNLAEMEAGYGTSSTRVVALQASFKPKIPDHFVLHSSSSSDRSKVQLGLRYANAPGIGIYELSLKQPPPPASQNDGSSWFDWFPKVGVFGVAMIGVVIWNVRSMSGGGGMDEFDEEYFKEKLRGAGLDLDKGED